MSKGKRVYGKEDLQHIAKSLYCKIKTIAEGCKDFGRSVDILIRGDFANIPNETIITYWEATPVIRGPERAADFGEAFCIDDIVRGKAKPERRSLCRFNFQRGPRFFEMIGRKIPKYRFEPELEEVI